MQTKLTLRLDSHLIRRAKDYARRRRKSVSTVVADYFASLEAARDQTSPELPPKVRSLLGAFGKTRISEKDYRRHLEAKYR